VEIGFKQHGHPFADGMVGYQGKVSVSDAPVMELCLKLLKLPQPLRHHSLTWLSASARLPHVRGEHVRSHRFNREIVYPFASNNW